MQKQNAESRNSVTQTAGNDARFVYTVGQLAEIFAVSDRTIQRLVASGMPQIGHGQYDLRACVAWQLARLKAAEPTTGTTPHEELAIAQRARCELETQQKRDTLLPRDLVFQIMTRMADLISEELERIPVDASAIADMTDPARVQAFLFERARATRRAIAARLRNLGAEIAAGDIQVD